MQVFRDTITQILRIAKSNSISSIAIPSLGVANLSYPENVSARILFEEIIAFHSRYPNSIQKYMLVIYDKNVFQTFSKEFAQQMSRQSTRPQVHVCVCVCVVMKPLFSIIELLLVNMTQEINMPAATCWLFFLHLFLRGCRQRRCSSTPPD